MVDPERTQTCNHRRHQAAQELQCGHSVAGKVVGGEGYMGRKRGEAANKPELADQPSAKLTRTRAATAVTAKAPSKTPTKPKAASKTHKLAGTTNTNTAVAPAVAKTQPTTKSRSRKDAVPKQPLKASDDAGAVTNSSSLGKRKITMGAVAAAPRKKAASDKCSLEKAAMPGTRRAQTPQALFAQYAGGKAEMGPEGVEALLANLELEPTARQVLLLAWKCGAARMGYFSSAEWLKGLSALGAHTVANLKTALDQLDRRMHWSQKDFAAFYDFAFSYCLTEPAQRIVDMELAAQMLQIALRSDTPHVEHFATFLTECKNSAKMTRDQWSSFLRFVKEVAPDTSNYDEESSWPLLLDDYVAWRKQQGCTSAA